MVSVNREDIMQSMLYAFTTVSAKNNECVISHHT